MEIMRLTISSPLLLILTGVLAVLGKLLVLLELRLESRIFTFLSSYSLSRWQSLCSASEPVVLRLTGLIIPTEQDIVGWHWDGQSFNRECMLTVIIAPVLTRISSAIILTSLSLSRLWLWIEPRLCYYSLSMWRNELSVPETSSEWSLLYTYENPQSPFKYETSAKWPYKERYKLRITCKQD
jgi:hypothetical protein